MEPPEEKKKGKGPTGGFQSLGLSRELLRGVLNMGYKVPYESSAMTTTTNATSPH